MPPELAPIPARPGDRLFRLAYGIAYRLARVWWFVRRPRTAGAVCAVWQGGKLLLLRPSYRPGLAFPGGFCGRTEPPLATAVRELTEETGIILSPERLHHVAGFRRAHDFRMEETEIFETVLDSPPALRLDGREIVAGAFLHPRELAGAPLQPPVRFYLDRLAGRAPPELRENCANP